MDKNAKNVVEEIVEAEVEAGLDELMEQKKMLERRIREMMVQDVTCERASILFPRKSTKKAKKWRIKFQTMCEGVVDGKERTVTLYTTNNEENLIGGINDVIRMMEGLKEELNKKMEKEKEEKKETKPKAEPKNSKTTGKGGNKK